MLRRSSPPIAELPLTPSASPSPKTSTTILPTAFPSKHNKNRPIPRTELLSLILAGRLLIIYNDSILDLTKWADIHPGGKLAVLHFVGRDATDEMDAYHSVEVLKRLPGFKIGMLEDKIHRPILPPIALGFVHDPSSPTQWRREGRVTLGEQALNASQLASSGADPLPSPSSTPQLGSMPTNPYPLLTAEMLEPPTTTASSPEQLSIEQSRSKAYRLLRQKITSAGLFTAPATLYGYGPDLIRYAFLASLAAGFYVWSETWKGQMCSAVALGCLWHQLTFVVHDAGHTGITGKAGWDKLIGIVLADWVGGLSLGWWKDNHNIHHLVTNHPEHDPDIQHIPFFAISSKFFSGLWSTYHKRIMHLDGPSKVLIAMQDKLYYIILSLGRFNLYALSYGYLLFQQPASKRDKFWVLEITGIAAFWLWFGMLLRGLPGGWGLKVGYLMVSHIVTSPVHLQIVLSHFARSTDDLGPSESFPSRQLRTTMDVVCSPAIEFLHGGLHLQVTHHLFPRLPRHNLRAASLLVKEFCKEQEMEYAEYGFVEGNRRVLGVLKDVADQLTLLKKVAEADARGELH